MHVQRHLPGTSQAREQRPHDLRSEFRAQRQFVAQHTLGSLHRDLDRLRFKHGKQTLALLRDAKQRRSELRTPEGAPLFFRTRSMLGGHAVRTFADRRRLLAGIGDDAWDDPGPILICSNNACHRPSLRCSFAVSSVLFQQRAQEHEQTRVRHVADSWQRRLFKPTSPALFVCITRKQAKHARRAGVPHCADVGVGREHVSYPCMPQATIAVPEPQCDRHCARRDLVRQPAHAARCSGVVVGGSCQRKAFLVSLGPVHVVLHSTGKGGTSTRQFLPGRCVQPVTTSCWKRFTATLRCVSSRHPSIGAVACAALFVLLSAQRVSAQSNACGMRSRSASEVEVTPSDRAENVARDAPIIVRYQPGADLNALTNSLLTNAAQPCGADLVCLFRDARRSGGSSREPVAGTVRRIDSLTVSFVADELFEREGSYYSEVARPGFDGAVRRELRFVTGRDEDREAPRFASSREALALSVDVPPQECDAPAGSLRVTLSVPRAEDDGNEGSVEVLVFLSRAAGLAGPALVDRARNPESDSDIGEVRLSFLLTKEQAAARVCIELRAVDGVGRVAEGKPGLCFDPALGTSFAPLCSTPHARGANPDGRTRGTLVACWTIAAALLVRRRRLRSSRATSVETRAK